jgi:hypothetical protein
LQRTYEAGHPDLWPAITDVTEGITPRPEGREAFSILASVGAVPRFDVIASVSLYFRVGFAPEEHWTPMLDDGVYPDAKQVRLNLHPEYRTLSQLQKRHNATLFLFVSPLIPRLCLGLQGDGVYSASLYSGLQGIEFPPGEMIRW